MGHGCGMRLRRFQQQLGLAVVSEIAAKIGLKPAELAGLLFTGTACACLGLMVYRGEPESSTLVSLLINTVAPWLIPLMKKSRSDQ